MSEKKPLEVLIINSKEDDRQEWLALPTDADKVRALSTGWGLSRFPGLKAPKRTTMFQRLKTCRSRSWTP